MAILSAVRLCYVLSSSVFNLAKSLWSGSCVLFSGVLDASKNDMKSVPFKYLFETRYMVHF